MWGDDAFGMGGIGRYVFHLDKRRKKGYHKGNMSYDSI